MRIRTLGDPVLKEQAKAVTDFDERLERLAGQMVEAMDQGKGIGLAAPQVGILSRVIVWRNPELDDELYVFINPLITERSNECSTEAEGCLSVPGVSVEVPRAERIMVKAEDMSGKPLVMELSGYPARIVQHEIDHLDGYLILDRATPEERRRVLKELRERTLANM